MPDLTTLLSKFLVQLYAGQIAAGGNGSSSAPALTFPSELNSGLYRNASNDIRLSVGGNDELRWFQNGMMWRSDAIVGFASSTSLTTLDTGITRLGAASFALGNGSAADFSGSLKLTNLTLASTTLLTTSVALTNNAAAQTATLTNGPTAGNPTKWFPINDNGTTRNIPAW